MAFDYSKGLAMGRKLPPIINPGNNIVKNIRGGKATKKGK